MANEDDRFFCELGTFIKRFPAKSVTLIFSSIVFLIGIGWSASKLLTPSTNIRERAAIEDAFRKHNISVPNQSDVVVLIQLFSDELKKKYSDSNKPARKESKIQKPSKVIDIDRHKKPIGDDNIKKQALNNFKERLNDSLVSGPKSNLSSEDILRKIYFNNWIPEEQGLHFKKQLDELLLSKDPVVNLEYFQYDETTTDVKLRVKIQRRSGSYSYVLLTAILVDKEYYAIYLEEQQ